MCESLEIRCSRPIPTVSLDVISLVASSCGYYKQHLPSLRQNSHVRTQPSCRGCGPRLHTFSPQILEWLLPEQLLESLSRKEVAPIRGYSYNFMAYDIVFIIFVVVYIKEA